MKREGDITEEELQYRSYHVMKRCIENKKTVAIAESCTGGKLSSLLSCHAGSSNYFLGGVVCYSNQLKIDILGVSSRDIRKESAVSSKVVLQMAEGIKKITNADINISISGIAGPSGGTDEKPVGTVYIGNANKENSFYIKKVFLGDRKMIINKVINCILKKYFNFY